MIIRLIAPVSLDSLDDYCTLCFDWQSAPRAPVNSDILYGYLYRFVLIGKLRRAPNWVSLGIGQLGRIVSSVLLTEIFRVLIFKLQNNLHQSQFRKVKMC